MSLSRLRALVLTAALAMLATPFLAGPARADAGAGGGTSVSGTWHRWDPLANGRKGAYDTSTPTVTVDQTSNLVDQVVRVSWTNFTPSTNDPGYNTAPKSAASLSATFVMYPVQVLECRAAVPSTSPIGAQTDTACYTAQVGSADGGHGQNNSVVAVTQPDGSGFVDLHVENGLTNDILGCDQTHACTIVVLPNNGGLEPATGSPQCDNHKQDHLGPPNYDQDNTAELTNIGGACQWADRIEVPIHFAALPSDCPNVDPAFSATGSPMLRRGLGQLEAGWCRGSGALSFSFNSTSSEYEARSLFGFGTDVALITRPAADLPAHAAYAPIANTGIAIAYLVDNARTGRPMTDLRLTPRLVAKLLTQSYQPFLFNCQSDPDKTKASNSCAPEVAGNPSSIVNDPEFQALNFRGDHPDRTDFPGTAITGNRDAQGGYFAIVAAGDSDLTYELTRWIAADKTAAGFLAGTPDASGMKINPNYRPTRGALYPTSQFQSLDPGWSPAKTDTAHHLQLGFQGTWNPLTGLDNVATTLVGNRSSAVDTTLGTCSSPVPLACINNPSLPVNFPKLPAEPIGGRNLWAVVDATAAQAYRFPTAQLVVDARGDAVAPTQQSMATALAGMATNSDGVTQYVDHAHQAAGAYPLTEPVYALVPTCGLSATKAAAIRSFLTHAAGARTYGISPGTLAPGLLALDAAQVARTKAVAARVTSTSCTKAPARTPTRSTTPRSHTSSGTGGSGNGGAGTDATTTSRKSTGTGAPRGGTSATPSSAAPSAALVKDVGYKAPDQSGTMSMALPLVLIVGAAFLIGAPLVWLLTSTSAGAALAARLAFWR